MAGSPRYKIYDAQGNYQAAAKDAYGALGAALIGYGEGATVRTSHRVKDTVLTITEEHWDSFDRAVVELWNNEGMEQVA